MDDKNLKMRTMGSIALYVLSAVMLFLDWFSVATDPVNLLEVKDFASYFSTEVSVYVTIALILAGVAILAAIIGMLGSKRSYGIGAPVVTGAMLIAALLLSAEVNAEAHINLIKLTAAPYLAFVFSAAALAVAPGSLFEQEQEDDAQAIHAGGVLIAESGEYAGAEFELSDGETLVLGRDPAMCSIVLEDRNISRQHCSIRYSAAEGKYYVTDLSSNGTFLEDGIRLQPQTEIAVERGEKVVLSNQKEIFTLG